MSELNTAGQHDAPLAGGAEARRHSAGFRRYIRPCAYVFIAVILATALMIWISFLPEHYTWALKVGLILAVACANAFVVAGFLMHLISEKKMIYTLLAFTVFFFAGLMGLTLY